jgi:hypothetical protein
MKNIILAISASCLQLSYSGELALGNKLSEYLGRAGDSPAPTFMVLHKQFDPGQAQAMMHGLGMQGRSPAESENGIYRHVEGQRTLTYNPKRSEYKYFDAEVGPFNAADLRDQDALKPKTQEILRGLLGKDAGNFHFVNDESAAMQPEGEGISKLAYKGFRFLRKQDGRWILGNTCQARIELGEGGRLRSLSIRNPDVSENRKLSKMYRKSALRSRLLKTVADKTHANSSNGKRVLITRTELKKGFDSLIPEKAGDKVLLMPHVSFLMENTLENGDKYLAHVNLPENAENDASAASGDVIDSRPR